MHYLIVESETFQSSFRLASEQKGRLLWGSKNNLWVDSTVLGCWALGVLIRVDEHVVFNVEILTTAFTLA